MTISLSHSHFPGRVVFFGGPEQIRTAVEAFAELCLAPRPQDPLPFHKNH